MTTGAVERFQRRAGLPVDGVVGARTRRALGRYGTHFLGSRPLSRGAAGWDVAALQFLLAWHGFPSATFDGGPGMHTERALRRFQRWAGLVPDGVAGRGTLAALRRPLPTCPLSLAWPLDASLGDIFGPRGNRFHAGIDLLAPLGSTVAAAAPRPGRLRRPHRERLGHAGDRRACRRSPDDVRPPSFRRGAPRRARFRRSASGCGRRHRQRDRTAPPLRGPSPRRRRGSPQRVVVSLSWWAAACSAAPSSSRRC